MEILKLIKDMIIGMVLFISAILLGFLSFWFLFHFLLYSFYPHPDYSYLYLGLGALLCYIFSKELFSKMDGEINEKNN